VATDSYPAARDWFVLVAGWPGSGKSTLAAALATELGLPLAASTRDHGHYVTEPLPAVQPADPQVRPRDAPVGQHHPRGLRPRERAVPEAQVAGHQQLRLLGDRAQR
jgi:hypothetical protein